MNKRGQLDELNPLALAGGLLGAILSMIVMSKVEIGLVYKIGAFIGTAIACYLACNKIFE